MCDELWEGWRRTVVVIGSGRVSTVVTCKVGWLPVSLVLSVGPGRTGAQAPKGEDVLGGIRDLSKQSTHIPSVVPPSTGPVVDEFQSPTP